MLTGRQMAGRESCSTINAGLEGEEDWAHYSARNVYAGGFNAALTDSKLMVIHATSGAPNAAMAKTVQVRGIW